MRKWIIIGSVVLVLAVAAAVALLNINFLVTRNKGYLLEQAEQTLGRKISVSEIEATFFTGIGLRLTNFAMSDDPAFSADDFVRARHLQANLKFWPLLKKEVHIKRVILEDPRVRIIRNSQGSFNFSTIGKQEREKKDPAEKEKRSRKDEAQPTFFVPVVDISDGDIRYIDRKDGADVQLRQIDLKVDGLDLNRPFSLKLAAAMYAEKQNLELTSKVGPFNSDAGFNKIPLDGEIVIDPLDMTRLHAALPKLKNALPRDLDLSGVYRVKNLKFKGSLQDLSLNGEIEGANGALRYGKSFQKPAGIPLTLNADARHTGEKLSIRQGRLKLHTLELATAGDIQVGGSPALNLSFDSQPASLEGWDKIIPALSAYQLTGTMEVQATVRGKVGKGAVPQIQGTLGLKNANAKPPGFPKPIEDLDTVIKFTGQRAEIGDMGLSLGRSRIRLTGAIENFAPLTLSYKMSTPEIWPADYQASLPEERKADVIRNLQSEGRLTMAGDDIVYQGKLNSSDGTLYKVAYKGLDAALSLADKVANIRSLRVNVLSGSVQMEGEYSFKEPAPRFTMASKVQGIDIKELYSFLDPKAEQVLRGRMNAEMKLSGSGSNWDAIKPTLRGQGAADVLHGALLNFNIAEGTLSGITGIPGLTNVINPTLRNKYPEVFTAKDTEFNELKANFEMVEQRVNVRNLRMSAAEFLVLGDGWADFARRVDFRARLHFSQRLSADLVQSAREVKYLLNNQGQLEVPIILAGQLPNVRPKPDLNFLGQVAQRGFFQKGAEELQNRYLGRNESSVPEESAPADNKRKRRNSTEDAIRKGFESLFRR